MATLFLQAPPTAIEGQSFELVGQDGQAYAFPAEPINKGGGAATSYVWAPGQPAADGVYPTFAALYAAMSTVDVRARKWVAVDDSAGAAQIPGGNYALDNIVFTSAGVDSGSVSVATVIQSEGAHFTQCEHLEFQDINVNLGGSTALVNAMTANLSVTLRGVSMQNTGGGEGLVHIPTGLVVSMRCVYSALASSKILASDAGATAAVFLFDGSSIAANAASMNAGATLVIVADGSAATVGGISTTQTPAPSVQVLDPTSTYVFRPGGTAAGNVLTSDQVLKSVLKLTPGPRTVLVDDTLAAAHFTGAGWDLDNTTLLAQFNSPTFTLNLDAGFSMTSSSLRVGNGLLLKNSATNPWQPTGGAAFFVDQDAQVESTAGGAVFLHATDSLTSVFMYSSTLGDGTHNVLDVIAGQTLVVSAFDVAAILAHATGGAGTASLQHDSSSSINVTQDTTTTNIIYLNSPNFVEAANNTGTGTGTTSAVTGTIAKKRSGKVRVWGVATGTISANGTATVSLLRDAVPIKSLPALTVLSTVSFSIPISVIDTLPDNANHTYTVQVVADGAHTIATGANGNEVQAQEL